MVPIVLLAIFALVGTFTILALFAALRLLACALVTLFFLVLIG